MSDNETDKILEIQGRILRQMVTEIGEAAAAQFANWTTIIFDHREARNSGSGMSRTVAVAENHRAWIEDRPTLYDLLETLLELREKIENGHWYGLLIEIKRSGEVDVKYDYNPQCIETFDDDEENHVPI